MVRVVLLLLALCCACLASAAMRTDETPLCCPPGEYLRMYEDTTQRGQLKRYSDGCHPIPVNYTIEKSSYTGYLTIPTPTPGIGTTVKIKPGTSVATPQCDIDIKTKEVSHTLDENDSKESVSDGWYVGHGKTFAAGVEFDKLYRKKDYYSWSYGNNKQSTFYKVCGYGFEDWHANTLCQKLGFASGKAANFTNPAKSGSKSLKIKSVCPSPDLSDCRNWNRWNSNQFLTYCRKPGDTVTKTAGLLCTGSVGEY